MDKKVRAIMNRIKKNHRGFSMIELITAIAILGVLSVTVILVMSTSSKTYSSLSVEAQLQSEAQLVANMITELAIDSSNAENTTSIDYGYPKESGKILILTSSTNGVKKEYIIGRKEADNELYLRERTYDADASTWNPVSNEALLGNYISGFSVDTSRVESENVLRFTLDYNKNGRTYTGNYQVLMRNRAYADKEVNPDTPESNAMLAINIDPTLVYIDVVAGMVPRYYKNSVSDSERVTLTTNGIPFTSSVRTNQQNTNEDVKWTLRNADESIFSMSAETAASSNLTWNTTSKAFRDSDVDSFLVVIDKKIVDDDGEVKVEASSKTAQILLRRIKSLSLYALTGVTQWKSDYETLYEGVSDSEAQGYAYVGSNGRYLPINLSASISASNIAYGGGVNWYLYTRDSDGNWKECTDASLAKLTYARTETSTTNTVTLGNNASNGQVYKVVAKSIFDDSFEDEYIFGIAPNKIPDKDGYNSRGFYTSMNSYWKGKSTQGDHVLIDEILWMECTAVSGGSLSESIDVTVGNDCACTDQTGDGVADHWNCVKQVTTINKKIDKVKIIKDNEGVWRLYVDYDAFSYGKQQKETFYSGDSEIFLAVLYRGVDGNYHMAGNDCAKFKNYACAQAGISTGDIKNVYTARMVYKLHQVTVTKVSPTNEIVVIQKGKDRLVDVKTAYYNIVTPRRGAYYLGVFLDDMDTNLMQDGMGTSNAYFDVERITDYGDTDKYVDEVVLNVTAKTSQKKYPTDPLTLRVTANDFYMINPSSPNVNSYTDYKVLIANVEGTDVYIPGPNSKASGFAWPAAANTAKTEVNGYNSQGSMVTATVYKSGNAYYCSYGGRKYTYSAVLGLWKK